DAMSIDTTYFGDASFWGSPNLLNAAQFSLPRDSGGKEGRRRSTRASNSTRSRPDNTVTGRGPKPLRGMLKVAEETRVPEEKSVLTELMSLPVVALSARSEMSRGRRSKLL